MDLELVSIEKNKTWSLVNLPKGRKAIGLKWVYKVKRDPSGKILKYNARILAKGYIQKYGVDYDEVYAPVARIETVRMIFALASTNGWKIHHLNVKSAFLKWEIGGGNVCIATRRLRERRRNREGLQTVEGTLRVKAGAQGMECMLRHIFEKFGFRKVFTGILNLQKKNR